MKIKAYFAGIMVIIAVFLLLVLGVSMVDSKAENRDAANETTESRDGSKKGDSKKTDEEDADASESDSAKNENGNAESGSDDTQDNSGDAKMKEMQDAYKTLVQRYNSLLEETRDAGYLEEEDIKDFLDEMGEILTELGEEDLESADEEDRAEITECIDMMNEVLDEYEKQMEFTEDSGSLSSKDDEQKSVSGEDYKLEVPDFTLTCWDGTKMKLSDQKGKKTIVTFWATWCGPCTEELKAIDKIRKEYSEDEVSIIAINCSEGQDAVKLFCKSNGYTFCSGSDVDGSIQNAYGVESIPQLYVLDENGKIILENTGTAGTDAAYKEICAALK